MEEIVKQKFQKLIDYQKKDISLRKLNNVIEHDASLADMNKNKRVFNDAKKTIKECETQASTLVDMYEDLQKYISDNEELFNSLENLDVNDEEELAERVKKLESLKSKFSSADKKVHDIDGRSKKLFQAHNDAVVNGKAAKNKYGDAKNKHDALVASKSDELEKLKSELASLRKELDGELFAEYKKLDEDGKFPPIAPASGDEKKGMFNCGGCGLALPQSGNAALNDKGYCRCDSCRRIIVKMDRSKK